MGQIMHVETRLIVPTQWDIRMEKMCRALREYESGGFKVPPVARAINGLFCHIDGTHRLIIADLFEGLADVYVPENPEDALTPTMAPRGALDAISFTNYLIRKRFNSIEREAMSCIERGCGSFEDLRKMQELTTVEALKNYCRPPWAMFK